MIRIDEISPAAFAALASQPAHAPCARLTSAAPAGPWNRWSYLPGPARLLLTCDRRTLQTTLHSPAGLVQSWPDPLAALAWLGEQTRSTPLPGSPLKTGWIGFLGYDLGRLFETVPSRAANDLDFPLFQFTYHDQVHALDHLEHRAYAIHTDAGHDPARALLFPPRFTPSHGPVASTLPRPAYERAVRRAIDYIAAGDIFQVNLSQRFTVPLPAPPQRIADRLSARFPAWFDATLIYGDHALLCNSPELFLRITPDPATGLRHILTRPIKGTRPRQGGMDDELRRSIKDQAELNMIVDLERNDLGRLCRIGSVRVTEPRTIEAHPTVYHGAATVEGLLRDDVTLVDLLRATFPGGSITGAPKIRAMQIIDELEPTRRGPYCGAIGYLSDDGHAQFNIAIRTILVEQSRAHIPVGAGIVADSVPSAEYEETLVKALALFDALELPRPREI